MVDASSSSLGPLTVDGAYRLDPAIPVSILASFLETSSLVSRIRPTAVVRFDIDVCAAPMDVLDSQ